MSENSDTPVLKATHTGTLTINEIKISCAVLEDGRRVISERSISDALGIKHSGGYWARRRKGTVLPRYLYPKSLEPFVTDDLRQKLSIPTFYKALNGVNSAGLPAEILPQVCDVWIKAGEAGTINEANVHIPKTAYILLSGFAAVGIIALVDEATGYQDVRPRDALQRYLDAFLLKEHAKWAKRFPDEFFQLVFQMRGWKWDELTTKRTPFMGRLINDLVYERLAPLVLQELRERNPPNEKGNRRAKHHQFLTPQIGHPKLQEHIFALMALLKASGLNRRRFQAMVDAALPRYGHTIPIQFMEQDDSIEPIPVPGFSKTLKAIMSVPPFTNTNR